MAGSGALRALGAALACSLVGCAAPARFDADAAWRELRTVLEAEYAYLDRQGSAYAERVARFEARANAAATPAAFIDVAQAFLRQFRDPHLNIGPYDDADFAVYPTGSDIHAVPVSGGVAVVDVKGGSAAFAAGLRPGMVVARIDGRTPDDAVAAVMGDAPAVLSPDQRTYAVNVALGGLRHQPRQLVVVGGADERSVRLPSSYAAINALREGPPVVHREVEGIGVIRFENDLGNAATVPAFRAALAALAHCRALVIDLRNTPSGGNTSVAEPILGHFTAAPAAYQHYRVQAPGTPWVEAPLRVATVSPQEPRVAVPFVVLAGRWTGSMGEGMVIGLDALGARAVVGAPMADLLGGIRTVELPASGAWLEVGFERMLHVDGRFREAFEPHVLLPAADTDAEGRDPALAAALELLRAGPGP